MITYELKPEDALTEALRKNKPTRDLVVAWLNASASAGSSGPPNRYESATLADFDDQTTAAIAAAMNGLPDIIAHISAKIDALKAQIAGNGRAPIHLPYLPAFVNAHGWPGIALCGNVGAGKTHLAYAIAVELQRRGYPVKAVSAVQLAAQLRNSFADDAKESADKIAARCTSAPILFVDDLDKPKMTPFVAQEFFRIIDERYQDRLPLIITTNAAPSEMRAKFDADAFGSYGSAIVDRLADLHWIRLSGSSRRGKAA